MPLVNPNIAMSFRPTVEYQPRNALAEYAQIQNIIGGQRQAEVAEMQLDQLRQDRDALRQIQAAIVEKGGPPDLNAAADAMIKSGRPEYMQQGIRIRETLAQQQRLEAYERQYYPTTTPSAAPAAAAAAAPVATEPPIPRGLTSTRSQTFDNMIADEALRNRPAPLSYGPITEEEVAAARSVAAPVAAAPVAAAPPALASATNALAPAAAAPVTTNAMRPALQLDLNALMAQYRSAARAGSPDAPAILKQIEAALRSAQTTLSDRLVPVGNLVFDRETLQYIAPTEAQRLQQQAPRAPIAVLQNGRPVYVTPEQAVGQTPFTPASVQVLGMGPQREAREPAARPPAGYRFTPSGDLEPIPGGPAAPGLSPRDIQKREAAFPQATQSVNGFQTKSDQFIAELERLRDDPGLNQITGPIYGRTPSVSREGSRAQALYDKIFAKGGFQALQDMREASKTGGALGNVSNEEGRRLERSIVGGLDRTQNLADVQQGINDLIAEIRVSQSRVREAYESTYEYRRQRGEGAAPGGRQLSPQDRQALDWANSNPKDPRAAQIKSRLGVQ